MPWNVTAADFDIGDFDMLLWQFDNYEAGLLNDYVSGGFSKKSKILHIYNMPLKDIFNDEVLK